MRKIPVGIIYIYTRLVFHPVPKRCHLYPVFAGVIGGRTSTWVVRGRQTPCCKTYLECTQFSVTYLARPCGFPQTLKFRLQGDDSADSADQVCSWRTGGCRDQRENI
ncbi:hypothetical protein ElyMa_005456000 [Elysia marginata]|uniref:Secreted protein n=1 Tax=Elysia marginata TaxID=1093978 RepID=A0AAV4EMT5_9GAST|nr:hypothetical protein ElyMa_005456000 [Elysia marginata]